jgi:hypothetical protein
MHLRLIGVPLDQAYHEELQAGLPPPRRKSHRADRRADPAETVAALARAEVFCCPRSSRVQHGAARGGCRGCVCIASDVGGARDLDVAGGSVVLIPSLSGSSTG